MTTQPALTDEQRGLMWQAVADVRDAAPRLPDDAATDDILDALEPLILKVVALAEGRAWVAGFAAGQEAAR